MEPTDNKKSQRDKFKEAARNAGADQTEEAFDAYLRKVAGAEAIQHASDCAIHNAPALKPGRCDCGATRGQ